MREDDGMTLTEFLLARIAEDEAVARAATVTPGAESWHWVDDGDDTPITEAQYADVIAGSLRSEAEFASTSGIVGELPVFLTSPGGSPEILWVAADHIVRHDPARVLAECEAKRRIVELNSPPKTRAPYRYRSLMTLQALALPYANHQDEWKP